jgi:hypothetical protein
MTYRAFVERPRVRPKFNCEGLQELEKLDGLSNDKGELVKQLATFVATERHEEDQQVIVALMFLDFLDLPPSVPIRVLAPYLNTDNVPLRQFVVSWFQHLDKASNLPLKPGNYQDYAIYVRSRITKNETIPDAFVNYLYDQMPDRALIVFYFGHGPPQKPNDILLAEHTVSNALWLKENEFDAQFQKVLPEANAELAKLARHEEWWVRLYVAKMMGRHLELRQDDVIDVLAKDKNSLVAKAAAPNR